MKRKASSEQDIVVDRDKREDPSTFYTKYLWKQISRNGEEESGRILRTVYCQFGKWCAKQKYMVQETDHLTKLWWFKCIVPFLCHEDPCVKVLNGHTQWVRSVIKLNDTTIVSGSSDTTLRVWNLTNNTSRVLNGHTSYVFSVIKLNETTIVSGSRDSTLRVWDLTNNTSRVLRGHTSMVFSVMKLNETTIVSGNADRTLRVWDLRKAF